ncbi:hypothetical protein chiPu_0016131 [Chiloscyllium punctatum]|uniref:Uncharacterized protein n=1 Tax=Chiloscyllium punctatum TaxID=137246 RepID=A0A401T4N3_CHIPU|nr:hypothetical protein [Chiloscyllium punctatum]
MGPPLPRAQPVRHANPAHGLARPFPEPRPSVTQTPPTDWPAPSPARPSHKPRPRIGPPRAQPVRHTNREAPSDAVPDTDLPPRHPKLHL